MMKKNSKYSNTLNTEILLENILKEDIQKLFYPSNAMHKIFLTSKFTISDNFITPNKKRYNIIQFLVWISLVSCYMYTHFCNKEYCTSVAKTRFDYIDFFIYLCTHFSSIFTVFALNVTHCHKNILLILRIQMIHEKILLKKNIISKLVTVNWIAHFGFLNGCILVYCCYCASLENFYISYLLIDIWFITFDLNIVYGIRILSLLRLYVIHFKDNIMKRINELENYEEEIFKTFDNILLAYNLFVDIFKVMMIVQIAYAFSRVLWNIHYFIEVLQKENVYSYSVFFEDGAFWTTLSITLWIVKDITLAVLFCLQCELFYVAIEDFERTCLCFLREKNTKLYKKIICLKRTYFKKMSACGCFYVDGRLPLRLLGIIMNYTIVLLQFAFTSG